MDDDRGGEPDELALAPIDQAVSPVTVAATRALFGWGILASISGVVIANGGVEVETRDQVAKHIDGGTVGEILMRDGALLRSEVEAAD